MDLVTDAIPTLSRMPPISLADLTEAADLQTRIDRKYLVPLPAARALVAELARSANARVLQIDGRREMSYESVYFDTPKLVGYLGSARRRRRRFKVRTRTYCDSGDCFLEVKTRGGRGTTVKQRMPYPASAAGVITADGTDHLRATFHHAGIEPAVTPALRATLRVGYRRSTLYLPHGAARVTLDTGLIWEADGARVGVDGLAVIETKSGSGVPTADHILWEAGHRPARISKYCTGMAALHPDLPANKWHRTLTSALAPALRLLDPAVADREQLPRGIDRVS